MKYVTIDEIITYLDEQCPNTKTREEKIRWISELDERIYADIIVPRLPVVRYPKTIVTADIGFEVSVYLTLFDYNAMLGTDGQQFSQEQINTMVNFVVTSADVGKTFGLYAFNGYDDNTDGETVLLVPSMFKDIYIYWIEKNVDIINREMGSANNAIALFQSAYDDYYAFYNRNNQTTQKKTIRFFGG